MTWALALELTQSLATAALIGVVLSLHPMRLLRHGLSRVDPDTVRAQILITVCGALMVSIVGDSSARAFGLLGIGSFIRFRTVLKNARDTSVILLLIGLGMACGMRHWPVAIVGTAFTFLLLFFLDLGPDKEDKKKDKEPPMPGDDALL